MKFGEVLYRLDRNAEALEQFRRAQQENNTYMIQFWLGKTLDRLKLFE